MVDTECELLAKMISENLNVVGLIHQGLSNESVHYIFKDGLLDLSGNLALAGGAKTYRALKAFKGKLTPKWVDRQINNRVKKLKRKLGAVTGTDKLIRQYKLLSKVTQQGFIYNSVQRWIKSQQRKGIKLAQNYIKSKNILGNHFRRIRNIAVAKQWQRELKAANRKYSKLKDPTGLIGRFLKAYTKALVPPLGKFKNNAKWFRQFERFFCGKK